MFAGTRKFVTIALFTVLLIGLVNLAWWLHYHRTEQLLEQQLSRRLAAAARIGMMSLTPERVENLRLGDFETFMDISRLLEDVRSADSLSEMFVLDEDYHYLATTLLEPDSLYFLAGLNGRYIDSLLFGLHDQVVVTPSYQTGQVYLKSAFVPLSGPEGYPVAVLGVEASVDYFDSLADLRRSLWYATVLSVTGGLLLGGFFLLLQQRINRAEQQLYLGQTQTFLGRMVAVVAHELKNPLMIIRASAERLVKKTGADEAEYIEEEVDRLNEIVTGYLEFARGDASLLQSESPVAFDLDHGLDGEMRVAPLAGVLRGDDVREKLEDGLFTADLFMDIGGGVFREELRHFMPLLVVEGEQVFVVHVPDDLGVLDGFETFLDIFQRHFAPRFSVIRNIIYYGGSTEQAEGTMYLHLPAPCDNLLTRGVP